MADNEHREHLSFIVGEERLFKDIVHESDIMPILEGAVRAGTSLAFITDDRTGVRWSYGENSGGNCEKHKIILEGEPVATLEVHAANGNDIRGISKLVHHSINTLIKTNLKRMLTSEIHTTVVNHSYEELVKINQDLAISEQKYRELSESLEEKVKKRTEELQQAHAVMLQQEKMASIGSLAAGMAHEINNPMGFVASNLRTLSGYFTKAGDLLELYRKTAGSKEESAGIADEKWKQMKMDFILKDASSLINESLEGVSRVSVIVKNLRAVSHIDDSEMGIMDINAELDGIVVLLAHEMPPGTRIIKNYTKVPGFECMLAMVSQAFLNVLHNALMSREEDLEVNITTFTDNDWINVEIADNGSGVPDEIKSRIFEPFFTTRDVGKGKGLGLTTAYETITGHGGEIDVFNKNGAVFLIKLPIRKPNG